MATHGSEKHSKEQRCSCIFYDSLQSAAFWRSVYKWESEKTTGQSVCVCGFRPTRTVIIHKWRQSLWVHWSSTRWLSLPPSVSLRSAPLQSFSFICGPHWSLIASLLWVWFPSGLFQCSRFSLFPTVQNTLGWDHVATGCGANVCVCVCKCVP